MHILSGADGDNSNGDDSDGDIVSDGNPSIRSTCCRKP